MDSKEIEKRRLTLDDHMHLTKDGVEFWYAREVMGVFGYTQWRRFEETIKRAMISLESSKTPVRDHFADIGKMVPLGSGAERLVKDYMLTRYACYLIAQNGDPRKEEIAFAQSYFALQTRKQELIEHPPLSFRAKACSAVVEKSPANRLQTSVTSPNRPPPQNLLRNRIHPPPLFLNRFGLFPWLDAREPEQEAALGYKGPCVFFDKGRHYHEFLRLFFHCFFQHKRCFNHPSVHRCDCGACGMARCHKDVH